MIYSFVPINNSPILLKIRGLKFSRPNRIPVILPGHPGFSTIVTKILRRQCNLFPRHWIIFSQFHLETAKKQKNILKIQYILSNHMFNLLFRRLCPEQGELRLRYRIPEDSKSIYLYYLLNPILLPILLLRRLDTNIMESESGNDNWGAIWNKWNSLSLFILLNFRMVEDRYLYIYGRPQLPSYTDPPIILGFKTNTINMSRMPRKVHLKWENLPCKLGDLFDINHLRSKNRDSRTKRLRGSM